MVDEYAKNCYRYTTKPCEYNKLCYIIDPSQLSKIWFPHHTNDYYKDTEYDIEYDVSKAGYNNIILPKLATSIELLLKQQARRSYWWMILRVLI